jgi:hypothetical protein
MAYLGDESMGQPVPFARAVAEDDDLPHSDEWWELHVGIGVAGALIPGPDEFVIGDEVGAGVAGLIDSVFTTGEAGFAGDSMSLLGFETGANAFSATGEAFELGGATGPVAALADGEVPLGTDFDLGSHNMVASLYRDGILAVQRQFVSGNLSAGELELAEQQGLAVPWRIGDTENRALRAIDLQPGDILLFDGQFAPCGSCQSAMINRSMESGAEIQYRFLDSAGNVRIWSAQQGGYIYGGF